MESGEIRWYKFQKQGKRSPVLILTLNSVLEHLGEVRIAPITSSVKDIQSEVSLSECEGLPEACAIDCNHIQTVPNDNIGTLITTITPDKLSQVSSAIRSTLEP